MVFRHILLVGGAFDELWWNYNTLSFWLYTIDFHLTYFPTEARCRIVELFIKNYVQIVLLNLSRREGDSPLHCFANFPDYFQPDLHHSAI